LIAFAKQRNERLLEVAGEDALAGLHSKSGRVPVRLDIEAA
jgi:hypothetical protein